MLVGSPHSEDVTSYQKTQITGAGTLGPHKSSRSLLTRGPLQAWLYFLCIVKGQPGLGVVTAPL